MGLEAIVLSLKLSTRTISSKRRRSVSPRKCFRGYRSPPETIPSGLHASLSVENPDSIWGFEAATRLALKRGRATTVCNPHGNEELLFDDGDLRPEDECQTYPGTPLKAWSEPRNPTAPLKRRQSDLLEDEVSNSADASDVKVRAFLELVDMALRISISGKPHKMVPGVKIMQEEDEGRLTDVAPALFSPNFLAVSP